ncbi:MAG TPA: glycosyltransferase, partial [Solirubrobacteraceae bacterium]|nr:glycosyltransferase [Solirubrobacteraceae bacterium]
MPVLVLAPEPLHPSPTGPSRRALRLAEAIAAECPVTLAAPAPSEFPDGPFRTIETGPRHDQELARAFAGHDVAVVQTLPSPRQLLVARRHAPRLVVDLIAAFALELREMGDDAAVRWRVREMVAHLAAADLVVCSNEHQRDLVIGVGMAAGLLDPATAGGPLDERLVVVPHGLDRGHRRRGDSALRSGELAGAVRIAIWGGGIWSWLDPLTAIRAIELLRPARPDVRLAFVGLEHPDPAQRAAHAPLADEARAYVEERGLGEAVVFRPRWLDRDEFLDHLADADVGVSLHGDTLEGRFASRTRILDYLEAGLPVVASSGDAMAGFVERHGWGRVVAPGDAAACAAALDALTGGGQERRVDDDALAPLLWENVARPLVEFCAS